MFRKNTFRTTNTKTDDDSMILSAPLELRGVTEEEEEEGSDRRVKVIHDLGSRVHATFTFTKRMMDSMESESDWTEDFRVRRRRFSGDCSSEKAFAIDVSIPSNPFFRYYCEIDEMQFETMKQKQNLSVNLNGFYLAFKESLVSCKTRESANVMVFTMNGTDGMGTLACLEDLGHKHVETLRIDFVPEMAKTLYGEEEEYAAPFAAPRRR
ncbi:unnamed protein product [Bathycoccus prasinos]